MPPMFTRGVGVVTALVAVSFAPAVAAQPLGPSTIAEANGVTRAIVSVALIGLVGAAWLTWKDRFVDRAVDDTLERPLIGVFYGILAFVLVLFAALYVSNVITRLGLVETPLGYVVLAILVGGVGLLAGFGSLVVGILVTDVLAVRRPWQGLALGTGLCAVGWLFLPELAAAAVWVLVPAIGLGGPMRRWVHRDRTVESELHSR